MPQLTLRLFGPPRLALDGLPVETDRRKALALLAYLAVTGQIHSRAALAALFWPDYDQSRAYAYLRRTLWEINQAVGEGWVLADREAVSLNPDAKVWLDVAEFQKLLAQSRADSACQDSLPLLTQAAALYQNDFLAGFSLKDTPAFDDWLFFQAEGLRRDLAGALETLVRCHLERGDADAAISFTRRWLSLDPLNEGAHRELMRAYEQAGQHTAALRQYQACVRVLKEELGADPQPETTALYEQIRAGAQGSRGAGEITPLPLSEANSRAPAPAQNLPSQLTPFIGRADELAQIAKLLSNPDCRLLTLAGPGGSGKTRLALQAAEENLAAFSNGVYFVPLAPVGDPAFIVPAIADAIGFSFFSQSTADEPSMQQRQLLNFLSNKHMLLVLDNFEHLLSPEMTAESTGLLIEILRAAAQVKILVTSRERLNLQEEWVLTIGGMRVPEPDPIEDLEAYSAVRLFVHNARKTVVSFKLTEAERPYVVRICQLVEGLPLGLELASAWVKSLSCREIAEEIERSLDFLTTPLRNVSERHQSLRGVFEYSWNLLNAQERAAFKGLSVFSGEFSREAALAVAEATLPLLTSLVDKSLLYHHAAGRFELHQLLQQYAAEKLAAAPELKTRTRSRHSAYYADFVRSRGALLHRREQRQALAQIAEEIENIRAGWQWAVSQRDSVTVEQYLDGLLWFYDIRSRFQEAEELTRQALADLQSQAESSNEAWGVIVGQLLAWHGWFSYRLSRYDLAHKHIREGLAQLRSLGERGRKALPFVNFLALYTGLVRTHEEGEAMLQEALAYYQEQNDSWGIATLLPAAAFGRGFAEAKQIYLESLAIHRANGDDRSAANLLVELGELVHNAGEHVEARRYFEEGLALARELDDRYAISLCLDRSGFVARQLGDFAEARREHEESLVLSKEIGEIQGIAGSLDNLGLVAFDLGDFAEAERLFREALALRQQPGQVWTWPIVISLTHLAEVALARSDYAEAERILQKALSYRPYWPSTLNRMGDLRRLQGNLAEAEADYRQAVEAIQGSNPWFANDWIMMETLLGFAAVRTQRGETASAIELLAFIVQHPASDYATRTKARRLFEEVAGQLSAAERAEAEARGRAATLEQFLLTFREAP